MGTGSGSILPKMQSHGLKIISSNPMDSSHPRKVEELEYVCDRAPIIIRVYSIQWYELGVRPDFSNSCNDVVECNILNEYRWEVQLRYRTI